MPTAAETRNYRLAIDLRAALRRHEFSVRYMPAVELTGAGLVGLEALVRWEHPQLGTVSPVEFVAIAERYGLAGELGELVREMVVADVVAGRLPAVQVAVNVSGAELSDPGFCDRMLDLLERHRLDASRFTVEVTETAVAADVARAAEALLRLRAAGLRVAIDDFGTGHASLDYLASLPCDVVKIDARFVAGLGEDERCTAIVQGVIGMAHGLGLTVVAEGVETPQQRDQLAELRCEEAQGFLFGEPVPVDRLAGWDESPGRAAPATRAVGRTRAPALPSGQTVLDLAHDLEEAADLQQAFARTLQALRRHVEFTGGSVQLVGDDGIRLAAAHPPPTAEALAARLPAGQGVGWGIVTSGQLRYIPDIVEPNVRVPSRRRRTSTTRHTRSYLGSPLPVGGVVVGLVQIDSVDVDAFTPSDQLLLAACACVLAAAVASRGWATPPA